MLETILRYGIKFIGVLGLLCIAMMLVVLIWGIIDEDRRGRQ